jgi:activator of HSP90 ATPase
MVTKSIKLWTILPCTPDEIFSSWLDSRKHGDMIGADAKIEAEEGGKFSMWSDSISGVTLSIDSSKHRIVQQWRSEYDDWPMDKPSKLIVEFLPYKNDQTKVRLWQSEIPYNHAKDIELGWKNYYWKPIKEYFANK